jgi:transcriptional regulator with XRE-family HTH domain
VQNGHPHDLRIAWPQLAAELKGLRQAAELTTRQLADQLGVSQGKVTKIENARTVPSVEDVQAWAAATSASADQAARLVELAERTQTEAIMVRAARRAGLPDLQRQVAEAERVAATIRVFYPTLIPGLLQTPDYARLVVTAAEPDRPEVAEALALRMQRQTILHEEGRRFEFVVGEAALRWRYGPVAVQLGQLDRIRTVAMLANVLVAVLPLDREAPVWHSHGFTLFEDRADDGDPFVHVETLTSSVNVAEPADVERYRQTMEGLRGLAVADAEATALLEQLAREYGWGRSRD